MIMQHGKNGFLREANSMKPKPRNWPILHLEKKVEPEEGAVRMLDNNELLLRVGRLNYVWTNTESLLIYVIAHLLNVEKDAAIVIFLTLNTTRARIDLVERLSKLPGTPKQEAETVLEIMARLKREAKMRNKYNHCIYSFDETGQISSTQLMRLVESDKELRYGKVEKMDGNEISKLEKTIGEIGEISRDLWAFIRASTRLREEAL
jgi:hypothetical protein